MTILEQREQKGIEIGIQKGIQQGKIEMIRDLIREGVDVDLIIKTSKLSKEEIEEVREKMLN